MVEDKNNLTRAIQEYSREIEALSRRLGELKGRKENLERTRAQAVEELQSLGISEDKIDEELQKIIQTAKQLSSSIEAELAKAAQLVEGRDEL